MIGNALKIIGWLYLQDKDQLFEINKYKEKRNKLQNSKYWKLLTNLSIKTKIGIEELHFNMIKNFSPRYEIMVPVDKEIRGIEYYEKKSKIVKNGKEFNVYHVFTPSHELNTSEFSMLLTGLCEECRQQGIETLSPNELAEIRGLDSEK